MDEKRSVAAPARHIALALALLVAAAAAAYAEPIPIAGWAVDEADAPLAGVEVTLHRIETRYASALRSLDGGKSEPMARARTRADGSFRLRAPGPGAYELRLAADGRVPLRNRLTGLLEPTEMPVATLEVDAGIDVEVVDVAGRPLEGVSVDIASHGHLPNGGWYGTREGDRTDRRGRVRLSRLAAYGFCELWAHAPGRSSVAVACARGDGPTRLVLADGVPRMLALRRSNGEPARGAIVGLDNAVPVLADDHGHARVFLPTKGTRGAWIFDAGNEHARAELEAGNGRRPLRIRLQKPLEVVGEVVDAESGAPLAGAWVWASSDPAAAVRADADGAFRVATVATSRGATVVAAAPGYRPGNARVEGTPSKLSLRLPPAAELLGRTVDEDGEPVAGARVTPKPGRGSWRSDADGRFRLPLERGTSYRVEATAPALAPGRGEAVVGMQDEPLVLVLPRGAALVGRAVGADGEPVTALEAVYGLANPRGGARGLLKAPAKALEVGGSGAFSAQGLEPGRYVLWLGAPGFASTMLDGLEVGEAGSVLDLGDVELVPEARLEGTVVDEDGKAVADASVQWGGERTRPLPRPGTGFGYRTAVVSDAAGRFSIAGLAPRDTLSLRVEHEDYAKTTVRRLSLPPETPLRIVLERRVVVRGHVLDAEGRPVADATVTAQQPTGALASGWAGRGRETRKDGSFEVAIDPGQIRLQAHAPGYRSAELGLDLRSGQEIEGLTMTLERSPTISGRVLDPRGEPVVRAMIRLEPTDARQYERSRFRRPVYTGPDGRYEITVEEPSQATLFVQAQDFAMVRETVEIGDESVVHDIHLSAGNAISGIVLDADGAPIGGAQVHANLEVGSGGGSAVSRGDGSWAIERLIDGSYRVRAHKEGYAPASREGIELAGVAVEGIELRLERGATVVGRILGLDDDPLPEMQAWIHRIGYVGVDRHGRFEISDVPVGTWEVGARVVANGWQATAEVTVEAGMDEVPVEVVFRPGTTLRGRLLVDGEPTPGAAISLRRERADERGLLTAADGSFHFPGVAPGRHRLSIAEGWTEASHQLALEIDSRDENVELTLRLASIQLRGRVLDATGLGLGGVAATVEPLERAEGEWATRAAPRTDAAGAFYLEHAAPGAYRLRAVHPAGKARGIAEQVIEAIEGVPLGEVTLVLVPDEVESTRKTHE